MPELKELKSNNFIKKINLENFKSIKTLDLSLTNLNVLIGANGAGKSNFISFFAMLQQLLRKNLRPYVLDKGGQENFLCYGRKYSEYITAKIDIGDIGGGLVESHYEFKLIATNQDVFRFDKEVLGLLDLHNADYETKLPLTIILDRNEKSNYIETVSYVLNDRMYKKPPQEFVDSAIIYKIMNGIQVFHFHDTSDTSALKRPCGSSDNLFLRQDGGNLAGMVKLIYDKYRNYYNLIVETIKLVVPDFHDFVIRDGEFISLEWFNKNNVDIPWKAHYLSDGSLRFIALATLLLMPANLQPLVIIIDEPELGLHPSAIGILAGMIKRASLKRQVIISTQSPDLLARFEPKDVIVVDKKDKFTAFKRLSFEELSQWLKDFTLSELWQMNVIGGRP